MTAHGDSFAPIAANQAIYDNLYTQVYKKMYGQLKPSYEAIRKISEGLV